MSETLPKFYRYRVKRGDSLWKIARHAYGHGDLWEGISEANHLKRGKPILAGQELIIPTARRPIHRTAHGAHEPQTGTPQHPTTTTPHQPAPPPQIPLQHPAAQARGEATKSGPFQPARSVYFPKFKYELDGISSELSTPMADYKLTLNGEVTINKQDVITGPLTFTKKGIDTEYKQEADGIFKGLFSKPEMKVENGKAEVSLAIGSELKYGGRTISTSESSWVPPSTLKYTCKGQEIPGTYKGFEFSGVMGYEFEITFKGQPPKKPQAEPVRVSRWVKVGAVGLVALAGVIVVADVVKDIGTLGVGTAESPLSFAAAAELFGVGMATLRTAAP